MKTAKTTMKQFALAAFAGVLTAGTGFAQQSVPGASSEVISYDELNSAEAPDIIFSNLEQPSDNRFNSESSFPIAGRDAIGPTESSSAILIIPKEDVQAKVLLVALGYVSEPSWSTWAYTATLKLPTRLATLCRAGRASLPKCLTTAIAASWPR